MKPTPPLNTTPVDESGLTPTAMKTSTPRRGQLILAGIGEQNEPAIWEGRKGFWVQGDCLFIEADSPQAAIAAYRKEIVATSHNHFCGSIIREKDRARADKAASDLASALAKVAEYEEQQTKLYYWIEKRVVTEGVDPHVLLMDQVDAIYDRLSARIDHLTAKVEQVEKERDEAVYNRETTFIVCDEMREECGRLRDERDIAKQQLDEANAKLGAAEGFRKSVEFTTAAVRRLYHHYSQPNADTSRIAGDLSTSVRLLERALCPKPEGEK